MKKNYIKFMALIAVSLPIAFLSSCSDDDEGKNNNNGNGENKEQTIKDVEIKMDGVDFVKKNWLKYDENGNVTGLGIGKAIYETEPTVAYVGVEDLRDAVMHFNSAVKPANASMKLVNGNWQAILVDTLGNEQNRIYFDKVDDGKVLAKAYLDNKIGIESYITEIRYILTTLWPENATDSNSPFRAGCIYTMNDTNYVCLRSFGYGKDGLLVADLNKKVTHEAWFKSEAEAITANYPNLNTCKEICKELSSTVAGSRYWQLLCASAGQTNIKSFKEREYWTCTTEGHNICVVNLATNSDGKFVNAWNDIGWFFIKIKEGTHYWQLNVYRFNVDEKGEVTVWKSNDGIWLELVNNRTPNASEFVRNEMLERDSEKISLQ